MPAVVREADDRDTLLIGLVENVAREDLSPVEEARAYALLLDEFGLGLPEIADRVGKSKPTVSNRLRLLELPDDLLAMVDRGELTEGHARAVLAIPDQDGRRSLARRIVRDGLSVRAAERAARTAGARTKVRRSTLVDPELSRRVKDGLRTLTGLEVKVGPPVCTSRSTARSDWRSSPRHSSGPPPRAEKARARDGRSWIRTRDLRLIRAAL